MAICLNRLGDMARALGDPAAAGARYTEGLALFREIGNQWGIAATLLNLGQMALDHGADRTAARLLHDALELALDTGSAPQVAAAIAAFAQVIGRGGERDWAAELARLASTPPHVLDRAHVHIVRLLAWSWASGERAAAMTLGQAIAAPAD